MIVRALIAGMLLLLPALGFVLWDWMRREEREGERIDARLVRGHVGGGL